MINALYNAATAETVQFPGNPIRGHSDAHKLRQTSGYDSLGNLYVYYKTPAKLQEYVLIYEKCDTDTVNALDYFIQARNGDKNPFVWYDHNAVAHTVRFNSGDIKHRENYPGRHRVEFTLYEEI